MSHVEPRNRTSRFLPILLWTVGLVVVAAAAYTGAVLWTTARIPLGTSVQGIDIGGVERSAAADVLAAGLTDVAQAPLRVVVNGAVTEIAPQDAGLYLDPAASVERIPPSGWSLPDLVGWLRGGQRIEIAVRVDEQMLATATAGVSEAMSRPPQEPQLEILARSAVLTPGIEGRELDVGWLRTALVDAFLKPRQDIEGRFATSLPSVPPLAAEQARRSAQQMLDRGLVVLSGETRGQLTPRALARSVTFVAEDGRFVVSVDGEILRDSLIRRSPEFVEEGKNASFRIVKRKPIVVPAVAGRTVDPQELARVAEAAFVSYPPSGSVSVLMSPLEADLTDQEAAQLGVVERLSTFTQEFPYAAYRVQNIGQAARYLNGTLLMPGEIFSLNDTIKERTEANGYTVGFVIGPGGVFAEDLGGGVSTAATATWTAAFYAGMERIETRAHSIYISRYTAGLEATVAWGIFDMRFRNDTDNGVFITARTTNTSIKVTFWGTRLYDDIRAEFGPRRAIQPYATIYDESSTCLGQSGVDGFSIDVDRVFLRDRIEVKRETIHTAYRPAPRVICAAR
jgi:vancomycin resistance protein YoaR